MKKKLLFIIIALLLSVIISFLFLEVTFRNLNKDEEIIFKLIDQPGRKVGLFTYDKYLGWRNRARYSETFHWSYRDTLEQINADGWRDYEYKKEKPADVYRIAVIGCSRTYGYGVNMEETYPKQLEELMREKMDRKVEVLNFGVSGYGLSQFTLNYEKYVRGYLPDLVILQLYEPSIYRTRYTEMWGTPKPAFRLKDDKLKLANYPVRENRFRFLETVLIKHSIFYKFLKDRLLKADELNKWKSSAFLSEDYELRELSKNIIERLNKNVKNDGARLIVFVFGQGKEWIKETVAQAGAEVFILSDYADEEVYETRGDLSNPLPTGHWSPLGNGYVAEAIYNYLVKINPKGMFN